MFVLDEGEINEEQAAAIYESGCVFLSACPGSGKTRTLIYKVALELSKLKDVKRWVVAITYTNRAADEIIDRVERLGLDTSHLWVGTIHSFCLDWIIKPYGIYHDVLKQGFRVANSFDTDKIISDICSKIRSERISPWECGYYYTSSGVMLTSRGGRQSLAMEVLAEYHSFLEQSGLIDFEQILYFAYQLVSSNDHVAKNLSGLFSCFLIDEYQDTKEIQYSIISVILKRGEGRVSAFVVGDPNQAIYGSLGGYAIEKDQLEQLTGLPFKAMTLNKNYRSSGRIIGFYENFNVYPEAATAEGDLATYQSKITYDRSTDRNGLVEAVSKIIEESVEEIGIKESEICVIAPWWIHLAALTRSLVARLPQYSFDGPGLVPFSRDIDNFWYKLTRIILTESSPDMYVRKIRWANDVLRDMEHASVDVTAITAKELLRAINSLEVDVDDGLEYLRQFFLELFNILRIDFTIYPLLAEHFESFFNSTQDRIDRLEREGGGFSTDIDSFRKAFKPRTGIKVSTIHGVKGGEFDVVIAFGLLQGLVPNFSDDSVNSAKKLLFVVGSRAKKNLHLISEKGRMTGRRNNRRERSPTEVLNRLPFAYD